MFPSVWLFPKRALCCALAAQRGVGLQVVALVDSEEPGLFEKMRSRYHQGDHL